MFKTMSGCLSNKKLQKEDKTKITSSYIFNRYISGNIDGCMFGSLINQYDVPVNILYEYYRCVLSPKKIKYIPYIKDEKMSEDIEFVMKHYKCSREVASEYMEFLSSDNLKELKKMYGGLNVKK